MQPSRYLFKFLSFIPVLPGFTMIVQRIYQLVEVLELIASFFFLIKKKRIQLRSSNKSTKKKKLHGDVLEEGKELNR